MNYFSLFSAEHLINIGVFLAITICLLVISQFISKKFFTIGLSFIVIILKVTELVVRHGLYKEDLFSLLPIHLCNISLILAIICFLFPKKGIFEILYYWSPGAVAAILFPDVRHVFPNFVEISFFATHFFIIFTVLYDLIFLKFKPTFKGFLASFVWVNILSLVVYKINQILGTNYMYLNYKPAFNSPLDMFGPWPHYIIIVEIIYILLGIFLYLPFKKREFKYYS